MCSCQSALPITVSNVFTLSSSSPCVSLNSSAAWEAVLAWLGVEFLPSAFFPGEKGGGAGL